MDTPQFETAKYTTAAQNSCKSCGQAIGDTYYRVSGNIACPPCAEEAKLKLPEDSHSAFMRAMVFGAAGAVVGLAIYATFAIVTGFIIGYASLAVGYIVAKAMKTGSKGFGGQRYQIAAIILTYMAVSMAAIPISIAQIIRNRSDHARVAAQQTTTVEDASTDAAETPETTVDQPQRAPINVGRLVGTLIFAGLASPFLELGQSPTAFIGIFILIIGMRIAWKMMEDDPARHAIVGPFRNNTAAAPVAST